MADQWDGRIRDGGVPACRRCTINVGSRKGPFWELCFQPRIETCISFSETITIRTTYDQDLHLILGTSHFINIQVSEKLLKLNEKLLWMFWVEFLFWGVTFSLQGKCILVFLYPSDKCCLKGWRHGRWREKDTSRSCSSIWNFSARLCDLSVFTFPQVSLEMVAMITQCPGKKSSKRGRLLYSLYLFIIAVFLLL